ncbi:response regulator transcription factor [Shimazuella sp. AN120528]|uniref:response regulator n=1 Tax=Shimazuella soli TaxID=1892854 RepID=UPI001F0F4B70|nr:response regulator transcription factor [Shimazuella soli]MCH5585765.1 response regulator transcription factor [Shimazuella soli]
MIRIIIVDDQRLMREGLSMILELEQTIEVVALGSNGIEAKQLVKRYHPDVVLMDIRMPILDGVQGTTQILAEHPKTKILMLTTFHDKELIISAMQAGAKGYLLKDMPSDAIVQAIHSVYRGGIVMQEDVTGMIIKELTDKNKKSENILDDAAQKRLDQLTSREKEVLGFLGCGFNNKEVASRLYISEGTVKNHLSSILKKLEIRDRTQAALFALKAGLSENVEEKK